MTIRTIVTAFCWIAPCIAPSLLAGAQIPTVQVEFRILEPRFTRELGNRTKDAEKALLPILTSELEQRIGFLRFTTTPAPLGEKPYRLRIDLGSATAGNGEVRFVLALSSPAGTALGQSISWQFRGVESALEPLSQKGSVNDKIADVALVGGSGQPGELARKFAAGDFHRLVSDLLSNVPMAADGATMTLTTITDPRWVLPLQRGEVCLDLHSRFRVKHLLKDSVTSEELPLEVEALGPPDEDSAGPIIARVPDSPDQARSVGRLGAPGISVKIVALYMTKYLRRPVCSDAVAPIDAIPPIGGVQ
jgi:hypothetical protein